MATEIQLLKATSTPPFWVVRFLEDKSVASVPLKTILEPAHERLRVGAECTVRWSDGLLYEASVLASAADKKTGSKLEFELAAKEDQAAKETSRPPPPPHQHKTNTRDTHNQHSKGQEKTKEEGRDHVSLSTLYNFHADYIPTCIYMQLYIHVLCLTCIVRPPPRRRRRWMKDSLLT